VLNVNTRNVVHFNGDCALLFENARQRFTIGNADFGQFTGRSSYEIRRKILEQKGECTETFVFLIVKGSFSFLLCFYFHFDGQGHAQSDFHFVFFLCQPV